MFISARRDVGSTKSAVAVYRNEIWIGANLRLNVRINLADIAAVAHVLSTDADGNNIVGRAQANTGSSAQGSIEGSTGVGRECNDSDCRIVVAGSVGKKARYPFAVLSSPSTLARSASKPVAVFTFPVVLLESASTPMAVLLKPLVLLPSACCPVAVLSDPSMLLERASAPVAVLSLPVILLPRANSPLAVFRMPVLLSPRADDLLAVLKLPVVLFESAAAPVAVFFGHQLCCC